MQRFYQLRIFLLSFVLCCLLYWAYIGFSNIRSRGLDSMEPGQIVDLYFHSLAIGDDRTACGCVAESAKQGLCGAKYLFLISNIMISSGVPTQSNPCPKFANYSVQWRSLIEGDEDGRFVTVGRETCQSPWRITEIGTGP